MDLVYRNFTLTTYKTEFIIFFICLSESHNHLSSCWSQKPKCHPWNYLFSQLLWAVRSFTFPHYHCSYLISWHHPLSPDNKQHMPPALHATNQFPTSWTVTLLKFKTGSATSLLMVSHQLLEKIQTPLCNLLLKVISKGLMSTGFLRERWFCFSLLVILSMEMFQIFLKCWCR